MGPSAHPKGRIKKKGVVTMKKFFCNYDKNKLHFNGVYPMCGSPRVNTKGIQQWMFYAKDKVEYNQKINEFNEIVMQPEYDVAVYGFEKAHTNFKNAKAFVITFEVKERKDYEPDKYYGY